MSVMVRTPECFPHLLPFTRTEAPPLGHGLCPGGHHVPGVIGGWDCSCPCHRNGGKPAEPALFACDWGDCNDEAASSRWADDLQCWLPVCARHEERASS